MATDHHQKMKILVLVPYRYGTVGGQRYRIEQWARILEPQGVQFHFVPFESPKLKEIFYAKRRYLRKGAELLRCVGRMVKDVPTLVRQQPWDAVFLYRGLLPIGPPMLERRLARTGIPIIYDFDDAIFLSDVSEANRPFGWLKWPQKTASICRLSRQVIVGNAYLQAYARKYTDRVTIIPTTIDTDTYLPKPSVEIRGVPTIGWTGSPTTVKYLRGLEPALRALRHTRPFRLNVIGDPTYSMGGVAVESKDWSAQSEFADLKAFDIGIMPLTDDAWARGKCGFKVLLYMALGIPTVASPVGVNTEIISDGENGFLASTESEWVEKLSRLIRDVGLRNRFAREGRRTVEQRYAAKVQAPRLLDVLQRVCGVKTTPRPPRASASLEASSPVGTVAQ